MVQKLQLEPFGIIFFKFLPILVRPSPPNSIEDGYEDTETHYPTTCISSHRKNSCKWNQLPRH